MAAAATAYSGMAAVLDQPLAFARRMAASAALAPPPMALATAAAAAAAAGAPDPASSSFFGMADVDVLSPLEHPLAFARRAAYCTLCWGGFSFAWQCAFERYAALLERRGFLERDAHAPTAPRWRMLAQSLLGIAGTALPSALVQAYYNPRWTYGASALGALALVPYVFAYVLLFDAYYYWGHRLAHSVPWVYRLVHKAHHLPQASLDAGSTSYMSFLEGLLLSGLPFAPNLLLPILALKGNFWVGALTYYTILCLFYLGHMGCSIKRDILPVFALNPWLIVLGITANASRPQDHTAHHERVVCNYGVFFRLWDEACGTAAPPKRGQTDAERTKQLPITWRVMAYNVANFFAFFALPMLAAGLPGRWALALAVAGAASGPLAVRLEAGCLRALGLTRLVTRLGFWDGLRKDLRVTVEQEQEHEAGSGLAAAAAAAAAATADAPHADASRPELVGVVSLPRLLSAPLLSEGGKHGLKCSLGGGGGGKGDDDDDVTSLAPTRAALGHLSSDCLLTTTTCASPVRSPLIGSMRHPAPEGEEEEEEGRGSGVDGRPEEDLPPSASFCSAASGGSVGAANAAADAAAADAAADAAKKALPPQKLYVYHPRGDLMRGAFFAFGPRGRDPAHPLARERDVRLALPPAAARVLLRLPVVRELVALLGGVHPASVAAALKAGASVAVCLPGPPVRGPPRPPVAADAAPAFIAAALASGAALVPVVAVGEAQLAGRLPLRDKFVMPARPGCAVRVVFGEPVVAGPDESAQRLRARFAAELAALAARHGAPPPEPADL
jgi:sterol desaturase/sphingolipid hydroxylase (fatty acid hydroxylase superfamily)